jgi:hypothetical protein
VNKKSVNGKREEHKIDESTQREFQNNKKTTGLESRGGESRGGNDTKLVR